MDQQLQDRLDVIEAKVDATLKSVNKIKMYMMITAGVTIAVIVLPLIGLMFAIPALLSTYSDAMMLIQ